MFSSLLFSDSILLVFSSSTFLSLSKDNGFSLISYIVLSNTISPSVGTFSIKSNKSFVILSLSDTKNPLAPLLVILLSFIPGNFLIISSLHSLGTKYLTSTSLGLVVSISIVKAWPLSLIIINTLFFNETISVIPQSISNGNS